MDETLICELCVREVSELTIHHLIPLSEAKRHKLKPNELPLADLCHQCHKHLHALFSNRELGDDLNTVDKLREVPEMQKYLAWVKRIPGTQIFKAKR